MEIPNEIRGLAKRPEFGLEVLAGTLLDKLSCLLMSSYLWILQVLTEQLLCARHCARDTERAKQADPCLSGS